MKDCPACGTREELESTIRKLNSKGQELDEIRAVFSHGANEELWPPGMTLAQAVQKLVDERERWFLVTGETLPPLGEAVWLWDGETIWLGGRDDDGDSWLWGNSYGSIWHNGTGWDGDLETDAEYKPTHWKRLTELPND